MTGAALAVLLLAVAAAPAQAGFRYVPPAETDAVPAEAIAKSPGLADIGPPPGPGPAVSGTSVLEPRVWRVHAGETLRGALSRWGERAGADVIFLTDRRYRIDAEIGRAHV